MRGHRSRRSFLLLFILPSILLAVGCSPVTVQPTAQSSLPAADAEPLSEGFHLVKVKDGDSVVVESAEKTGAFECHLYGVDAPEMAKKDKPGQFFAEEAKAELTRLMGSGTISVLVTSRGLSKRAGERAVCLIKAGSVDVNLAMIEKGYAWANRKKLVKPFSELYVSAEERARSERLGLWVNDNPESPWDYRERMRRPRQGEAVDDL